MSDDALAIPVYMACPSRLTAEQASDVERLHELLRAHGLKGKALEASSYSLKPPLTMVLEVIQACYGGLILGFEHFRSESGVVRQGTPAETRVSSQVMASPWHQIETAVLLARNLPVLIFKDRDVRGGVFDLGTSDHLILEMPSSNPAPDHLALRFSEWAAAVRLHYEKVNSIFDVFLSFSGEDEAAARTVFEFLTSQGLRVFFSRVSIPELSQAEYMKAINTALDKSHHLVVVSGTAAGFAKPWVEREWMMFLNEKLSGRKSGNIVVVLSGAVPVAQLPIALRSQQVIPLSTAGQSELLKFVSTK